MIEITPDVIRQYFPRVVSWVLEMENAILANGQPLLPATRKDAEQIGIRRIDDIRIVVLQNIPLPNDPELCALMQQLGFITAGTGGMTFGHGIVLKNGAYDRELIAHELVHVRQYEQLGGIESFLQAYVAEVAFPPWYPNGPLEVQAKQIATDLCKSMDPA